MRAPVGRWLYCGAEDGAVYLFDVSTGQLENVLEACPGREIIGMGHHSQRNVLGTISEHGQLSLWKP